MTTDKLSPRDVSWIQGWLLRATGISIRDDQEYLLNSRLIPVAKRHNMSLHQLTSQLRGGNGLLVGHCIDALTTNETSWFRDVKPFNVLAQTVIPQAIERAGGSRSLSIWSAASSGGQELYSVAMLLDDAFPELRHNWNVSLIGTDISRRMVSKAEDARYSQLEVDRGLPAKHLVRYFDRDGVDWMVKPEIRRACRFFAHNLAEDSPPGTFDVILCRYVLIYFDDATRARVIELITEALKPGGVLLLGASEIGGRHVAHLKHEMIHNVSVFTKP